MKIILVIGGSSGIGLELVKILSEKNQVIATFNRTEPSAIPNVKFHPLNVAESDFNIDFLPERLDGLVYCPGAIQLKPMSRFSAADYHSDYQLQVVSAVEIIQKALPALKKSDNASIVLFSTVAVQMGFNFHSLVAASKGAIEGLTKALAAEFAPTIRVNAIAPSITDTPLAASLLNTPEKVDANAKRHPLKTIGQAQDVANCAAFLLSENAKWMTGQIIHIDGGMSTVKS